MPLPIVNVTLTVTDQTGNVVPNSIVTAALSGLDVCQATFVFPNTQTFTSDINGFVTMPLWPNALGVRGTQYTFKATHPTTGKTLVNVTSAVPNINVDVSVLAAMTAVAGYTAPLAQPYSDILTQIASLGSPGNFASNIMNDTAPALGSTVGAALLTLLGDANSLLGAAGQIIADYSIPGQITLSLPQSILTTSDVQFRDPTFRHVAGSGVAPTVSLYGTGAGTGPGSTFSGTDVAFIFNLTSGSSPAGSSANVAKLSFAAAYAAAPMVFLIPMNRLTAALQSAVATACVVGAITTTDFTLVSGSTTGLTGAQPYSWGFLVIGR